MLSAADSKANIDHLVVSAAGVHLIDAKNWTGDVTVANGSLRQQWTSPDGPRSAIKDDELDKVRRAALRIKQTTGQHVTPVLCLAGDRAASFGVPRVVDHVNVVAVDDLLAWLEAQPAAPKPVPVATLGVQLSCQFPPAIGGEPTAAEPTPDAPVARSLPTRKRETLSAQSRSRSASTRSRSRRHAPTLTRFAIGALALVALVTLGPKIAAALSKATAHTVTSAFSPAQTTAATPSPLSAARSQRLDDWSIRAGLYEAHDAPSSLTLAADSALGDMSSECRTQLSTLAPYRHGLLNAPDNGLAAAAGRYDTAAREVLRACISDHPVALHHAEGAVGVAASEVNTRFDRLLGQDPSAVGAKQVL